MRQKTPDFAEQNADQLRAFRHVEPEQLFRSEAESVLLIHGRDIIEPVEIRDRLQIRLLLDEFFSPPMQQTNMRVDTLDDLAIEFEHEAQHAVRRRMLRPEIDGEVAKRRFCHDCLHEAPASAALTLSATRALNFSHTTTARS